MRSSLGIVVLLCLTGCMRMHHVSADGQGGAYLVAQKQFLGISGKQTLVHCPSGRPDACGTVLSSRDIAELGPVEPTSAANNYGDLLGGLIDGWTGGLSGNGDNGFDGGFGGSGASDDGPETPCPPGALIEAGTIPEGTRVVLLAMSSQDAYAGSEHESQLPINGVVSGDLHTNDRCWMGGGFIADDGTDFYFYKAAFAFQ